MIRIERYLREHESGNLTENDVFVGFTRHLDAPNWFDLIEALPQEKRERFEQWGAAVIKSRICYQAGAGQLLSEAEIDALEQKLIELVQRRST